MNISETLLMRVRLAHGHLLKVTGDLTAEQFCRQPGADSPAIGWHLWHVARWTDRLQASFGQPLPRPGVAFHPDAELWHAEGLAGRWGLESSSLGLWEAGSGMDAAAAGRLPELAGAAAITGYAERVFALAEQAIRGLAPGELEGPRTSILEFEVIDGVLRPARGSESTHGADIVFHLGHSNRHLGMIEALRGWLGLRGTASV